MDDPLADSYLRHYGTVYRFVRRRTATRQDAEDLTHEVFEAAVAALAQARLQAPPPLAWLYTVARRRLIDARRRLSSSGEPLGAGAQSSDDRAYGPRVVETLVEALGCLTDAQRRVIVLKIFEGLTFAEIAARLGASEDACKMRFARGLARLREELEQKGVTP
jgi:RNA polymerase sigma factor (sigma-70 family)